MPRFQLSTGALELLKWLGVLLMFGDHINAGLFQRELPALTELGRLVFPIFACVLGYNLARPAADLQRVLLRICVVAVLAQIPHWWLFQRVVPLNVLFTFAAAIWCLQLAQRKSWVGCCSVFVLAGLVVEYNWPGIALVMATVYLLQKRSVVAGIFFGLAIGSLYLVNDSWWALAALPVIALASLGAWGLKRRRWAFYAIYPLHLVILAAVAHLPYQ